MKLLIVLLFFSSFLYSQNFTHHLGNEKSPHLLFQVKSDEVARSYLVQQIYDFLSQTSSGKNFFASDIHLQNNDIPVLLMIDQLDKNLSETLERSLFLNLGNTEKFSRKERQDFSNGTFDYSEDERFLNKIVLNIKLRKLRYEVDPSGVQVSNFSTEKKNNSIQVFSEFKFTKIKAFAEDICLSLDTFIKKDGKVQLKKSKYKCSKDEKEVQESIDAFLQGYLDHEVITKKKLLSQLEYFEQVGAQIKGIVLKVINESPLSLKLQFKLSNSPKGVAIKIVQGSIEEVLDSLDNGFNDNFDLTLNSEKSLSVHGLSGFVVQGVPLIFTDKDINKALQQRKNEIISLVLKPIQESVKKLIADNSNKEELTKELLLAGSFSPSDKLSDIGYQVDQISLMGSSMDNHYIGAGVNFSFRGVKKDDYAIGYSQKQEQVGKYLGSSSTPKEGEMVVSFGEEFFNDFISYALDQFEDSIRETEFRFSEFKFHIRDLPLELSSKGEEGEAVMPYLSGCVQYKPRKVGLKIASAIVGGESGVQVPLLAKTSFDFRNSSSQIPTFEFNISHVLSERNFLRLSDNCHISKRFKKAVARIASKKIESKFNTYSQYPLLRIELLALQGLSGEIVNIHFDREMRRMHIVLAFEDLESVRDQVIDKFRLTQSKIKVSFPKFDKIKSEK